MGFIRFSSLSLAAMLVSTSAFAASGPAYNGPKDGAIGFQESVTPVMDMLVSFHDKILFPIIAVITIFVVVLMAYILWRFSEKRNPVPSKTTHHVGLEVAWTIVPILVLVALVAPSMKLLYYQDVIPESDMTIKVTGNTWNWEYGYPDYPQIESFISNMLEKDEAAAAGKPYLFGSDAPLVVPVDTTVKVLVTSSNNIHSFAMPAFGIKMDAVPGRINETWFKVHAGKEGTYYGQCSEICGVRHAFMPIEIKVVGKAEFATWAANGGAFTTTSAAASTLTLPLTGAAQTAAPK